MPTTEEVKPTSFEDAFRAFVERSLQRSNDAEKVEQGVPGISGERKANGTISESSGSAGEDNAQTSVDVPSDHDEGSVGDHAEGRNEAGASDHAETAPDDGASARDVTSSKEGTTEAGDEAAEEASTAADGSPERRRGRGRGRGRGRRGRGGIKRAVSGSADASEEERDGVPPAKRARGGRGRGRGRGTALAAGGDSSSDATGQDDSEGRRRSSRRSRAVDFSALLAAVDDEDDPACAADAAAMSDGSASDEWRPKEDRQGGGSSADAEDAASSGDERKSRRSPERGRRGRGGGRRGRPRGVGAGRPHVTRYQLPKELEEAVHANKPPPETPAPGAALTDKPPTTGDFIIALEDADLDRPPIWRIDGKFLIQKYEPIKGKRQRLYKNMATYMSWTANTDKFRPVSVRYHQMGRTEIIVELLDNPHSASFNLVKAKTVEATAQYLENFEIYMQTLISQALDANFLLEVMEEGDEYFMKSVTIIKDLNEERKQKILELKSWDDATQSEMESLPCLDLVLLRNVPASQCTVCREMANPRLVQLHGRPYHPTSLQTKAPLNSPPSARKQYHMCSFCAGLADLYHKVVHQMFHLYLRSCEQVKMRKKEAPDEDSTRILNVILADEAWLAKMFSEVQMIWGDIDQIYQAAKEEEEEAKQQAAESGNIENGDEGKSS